MPRIKQSSLLFFQPILFMSLLHNLLDNAYQDTQFLTELHQQGDDLVLFRKVHFVFFGKDKEKTLSLAEFIQDNQYAEVVIEERESTFVLKATIQMPITQQLLCSISALMTCLSELFGVEYDGWECED